MFNIRCVSRHLRNISDSVTSNGRHVTSRQPAV